LSSFENDFSGTGPVLIFTPMSFEMGSRFDFEISFPKEGSESKKQRTNIPDKIFEWAIALLYGLDH